MTEGASLERSRGRLDRALLVGKRSTVSRFMPRPARLWAAGTRIGQAAQPAKAASVAAGRPLAGLTSPEIEATAPGEAVGAGVGVGDVMG